GVGAQGGPDARHLVRGHRGSRAGPAADDRLLGAAVHDVAGGGLARPGPVLALAVGEGAVHDRLVTAPPELVHHGLCHPGSLVRSHGDPHRPEVTRARSYAELVPELPEVEITARRLNTALEGAEVE